MGNFLRKFINILKGSFQRPFFYLTLPVIVSIVGISAFCIKAVLWKGDSDLDVKAGVSENLIASDSLFLTSAKNFLKDATEMSFVGKNSITRISSPSIVTSKALGIVLEGGDGEQDTTRKQIMDYVVESGDTLSSLAVKYNISLETILWANDLNKSSAIRPGQKLVIPPVSGIIYSVEKGDTIEEIAKDYKAKVEDILAFNEISADGSIFIGDTLVIPNGKMPVVPAKPATYIPLADSYFLFPCEGIITQGLHFSNAIDIANSCGKPIVAAAAGVIQAAGYNKTTGNRVTILHSNGVVTYYGHLSSMLVKPGQSVGAGDIIGYVGNTGYTVGATGCHLHFEVLGAKNFLSAYLLGSYLSWKK